MQILQVGADIYMLDQFLQHKISVNQENAEFGEIREKNELFLEFIALQEEFRVETSGILV